MNPATSPGVKFKVKSITPAAKPMRKLCLNSRPLYSPK
jgi:hypothetical protein